MVPSSHDPVSKTDLEDIGMSVAPRFILECNKEEPENPAIGPENNRLRSWKERLIGLDVAMAVMRKKTSMYLHETPTHTSIINLAISQGADSAKNHCVGWKSW